MYVRALDADGAEGADGTGCSGRIGRALVALLALTPSGSVLGDVAEAEVDFPPGEEECELELALSNTGLGSACVGAHLTTWRWQIRPIAGGKTSQPLRWNDLETTSHTVFTTLDTPTAPWQPHAADLAVNTQVPWVDAFDLACLWAAGSRSPGQAAASIARSFFRHPGLHYAAPGDSRFVQPQNVDARESEFHLTEMLDALQRLTDTFVNCDDCASTVSTLANLLGCSLWQQRMENLNLPAIWPIGASSWQDSEEPWMYHEVAWGGTGRDEDPVYDACVGLRQDPTAREDLTFEAPVLATGDPFSWEQARLRRPAPGSAPGCNPMPDSQWHRALV